MHKKLQKQPVTDSHSEDQVRLKAASRQYSVSLIRLTPKSIKHLPDKGWLHYRPISWWRNPTHTVVDKNISLTLITSQIK